MSEGSGWGPGELGPGSQVAGYQLEEQIGRGGMAVVFRARDSRLDRYVALKLLAPGFAEDDEFRQRFMRESRAAAAVDDPHIIPIYEAGEERGVLFIAMRFVRGGDLRSLLDRTGPLAPERAAELLSQAASALDSAHARGLVHRDVKPANMLLEASPAPDRPDHVYLADFGLAKASLAVGGLTSTGQFLGTLDYIAPEQVEGRPVDGRTDLYALGCVAFELLTGAPPFRRSDGMAVMYAQVSEPPPLLSSRRGGLPAGADAILSRALAKAPAERYPSCRDFAADLRRVLGLRGGAREPPLRQATRVVQRKPSSASAPPASPLPASPLPASSAPASSAAPAAKGPAPEASGPAPAAPAPARPGPARTGPANTQLAGPAAAASGLAATGPAVAGPASGPAAARPATAPGQGGQVQPEAGRPWPARVRSGPPPEAPDLPPSWFRPQTTGPRPVPPGPARPGPSTGSLNALSGLSASGPLPRQRRRWWRSPAPLAGTAAAVLVLGGGGYYLAGHQGHDTGKRQGAALPAVILKAPACSTQTAAVQPVPNVSPASVEIGGKPFGLVESADGTHTFTTIGGGVVMLSNGSPAPFVVRTFSVPGADKSLALTPDGHYLLAAGGSGAVVINVAQAEAVDANPVTGTLQSPKGNGAIGVAVSPDGKYAFVTLQNTTTMAVFNLAEALSSGFGPADFVGFVPLGYQPDGVGVSADGNWLYATSVQRTAGPSPAEGTLSIIGLRAAESSPATSVRTVVDAGCGPARVITSGSVVWVTARDSNELIAFSAPLLLSHPGRAILAEVHVGANPIGEVLAAGGRRLLVADTNLNSKTKADGDVAVIDTARALDGEPALLGSIPASGEPRQVTLAGGGTVLLMVNMVTGQLQAVNVSDLP